MPDQPLQNSLFEDDDLLRELGPLAHVPQVALTELVANAWDAGPMQVDLILPGETGGTFTVTDDGHGMTPARLAKRWMALRHGRLKHCGGHHAEGERMPEPVVNQRLTTASDETGPRMAGSGWKEL